MNHDHAPAADALLSAETAALELAAHLGRRERAIDPAALDAIEVEIGSARAVAVACVEAAAERLSRLGRSDEAEQALAAAERLERGAHGGAWLRGTVVRWAVCRAWLSTRAA